MRAFLFPAAILFTLPALLALGGCQDCEDGHQLCVAVPDPDCACYELYDPVCGCNDVTYSNSCYAECNGIDVYTPGACPD